MNPYENIDTKLVKLEIGKHSNICDDDTKLTSIPIDENEESPIQKTKLTIVEQLKSILSSSECVCTLSVPMAIEVKSCLIDLIKLEENDYYQIQLISTCADVIDVANRFEVTTMEDISDLVIACVTLDKSNLTKMILERLLTDIPRFLLWGESLQIIQYRNLIQHMISKATGKPKVIMFCISLLNGVFWKYKLSDQIDILSYTIPTLVEAMEMMVCTPEGKDFIFGMKSLLHYCGRLFENQSIIIISEALNLLKTFKLQSQMIIEIHDWLREFTEKFRDNIEQTYLNYIPDMVDYKLIYHKLLLPNNPECWFEDCYNSSIVYETYPFFTYSFLRKITEYLESDISYSLLLTRAEVLLKSDNWKNITTAIRLLDLIVCHFGKSVVLEPWEIFNKVSPYFSDDNPIIVASTIKLIDSLCDAFNNEFKSFQLEALSLVIKSATTQSCVDVKSLSLYVISNIVVDYLNAKHEIPHAMIQPFLDVIDSALDCNDSNHTIRLTESLYHNVYCLFELQNEILNPYIPEMVSNILKIVDKTFFICAFKRHVHDLLENIQRVVSYYAAENKECLISLIVKYVDNFKTLHKLPQDYLEIHPCFFTLLSNLSEYKSISLFNQLPKLGLSIHKLIPSYVKANRRTNPLEKDNSLLFSYPGGCPECFSRGYSDVQSLWAVVSKLEENYNQKFDPYVEMYIYKLLEILREENNMYVYENCSDYMYLYENCADNIYQLLKCFFQYGNVDRAKKIWNNTLKDEFLNKMNEPSNLLMSQLVITFADYVQIKGFDDALSLVDIQYLSRIFCNAIDNVIEINKDRLPSNDEQSLDKIDFGANWDFSTLLSKLEEIIPAIICVYSKEAKYIISPILKTISAYPKYKHFMIFFENIVSVFNKILNLISPKLVDESGLLPIMLVFSLDVLSNYREGDLFETTTKLILRLKLLISIIEYAGYAFQEFITLINPNEKESELYN